MADWCQINNIIFDREKVLYIQYDEKDSRTVYMYLMAGDRVTFVGDEAVELWRIFSDEKTWKDEA